MITLDTNIYVSAFQYGGKPMELLELALAGDLQIAVSPPLIDETVRVLQDKFGWLEHDLQQVLAVIDECTVRVTPTQTLNVIREDEPDNRVLECAVASGSEAIVSGDNDLLRIGKYEGIEILRIAEFMRRFQSGDRQL